MLALAIILPGILLFCFSTFLAVTRANRSSTREERLEALGGVIPAAGAMVCCASICLLPSMLGIALLVVGAFQVILRRAIYELIVFHK